MSLSIKKHILHVVVAFLFLATTQAYAQNDEFYGYLERKGYSIVIVENEKVRAYMDDNAYENPNLLRNYSHSIVSKYSKGGSSRPAGILLKWTSETPAEDIAQIEISLAELDDESNESLFDESWSKDFTKYYYPQTDSKEYLLCNMVPGKYCYYQIKEIRNDGQVAILERGRFYTDGVIRMLRVGGMYNVRDFGGWPTSFSKIGEEVEVAYGRIFRGNRPEPITDAGKNDFVKNEHITADLDLRGSRLSQSPLGPLSEVEYYCTNNQRYKLAVTGTGGPAAIAKDLNIIANVLSKGGSVYLHCNHGANRAGSLSVIIDGLLGLSEADICRDYELSSFAYGSVARGRSLSEMMTVIRSYGKAGDNLAQCFYNFARSIGVSERTLDTIRSEMLGLKMDDPRIIQAHR